jgi:hypothetical protein
MSAEPLGPRRRTPSGPLMMPGLSSNGVVEL